MSEMLVHDLRRRLEATVLRRASGRVTRVSGPLVRAELPGAVIGELCELRDPSADFNSGGLEGEVVGFEGTTALLSILGDTKGISIRTEVFPNGSAPMAEVGSHLLGSVVDARGRPLQPSPPQRTGSPRVLRPIHGEAFNILDRAPITRPLSVGVPAIDACLTLGEGQRMGIFGSAGVGKSTLLLEILGHAAVDVVVVALIGERGREAAEFVQHAMPNGESNNRILVVSTAERPALERYRAALLATTIAEYFRDEGKRVLLVVDSITRLARALRDVGLAAGEPGVRRSFPPSVFSTLPKLFERAGNNRQGSITSIYTILVEGQEMDDPVAEETRSLLDGHIILSNELAAAGRYPAIDLLASRSRTMALVTEQSHRDAAAKITRWLATIKDMELLVRVGEYRAGADPAVDLALSKREEIENFLYGRGRTGVDFARTLTDLARLTD